MSGRIRVWADDLFVGDWLMECVTHGDCVTTYSWESAYEAALGHAAMWHPQETP
jgi:hypothetical protein